MNALQIKFLNLLEEAKYSLLMGDKASAEARLREALEMLAPGQQKADGVMG